MIKLIALRLWLLKTLLADGGINLFLKISRLLEFLIFRSRLFHCIMADREKYFFKKVLSSFEESNSLHAFSTVFKASYKTLQKFIFAEFYNKKNGC